MDDFNMENLFFDEPEITYEKFSGVMPRREELDEEAREAYPFFVEIPYSPEHGYESMMRRWKKGIDDLPSLSPEVIESFVNSYSGVPAAMGNYFDLRFLADTNVILPFARGASNFDNNSTFHMGYFERALAKIEKRKNQPLWILYRNPERKDKSGKVFDVPHIGTLYRYNPYRGNITLLVKGSPKTFKLSRIQAYAIVPVSCSNILHLKFELSDDESLVRWESSHERFQEMWGYLSSLEVLNLELAREREAERKRWLREEERNRVKAREEEKSLKKREAEARAREDRRKNDLKHNAREERLKRQLEERRAQQKARDEQRLKELKRRREEQRRLAEERERKEAAERLKQEKILREYQEEQERLRQEAEKARRDKEARILEEMKAREAREKKIREEQERERQRLLAEEAEQKRLMEALRTQEENARREEELALITKKLKSANDSFIEIFERPLKGLGELACEALAAEGLTLNLGSRLARVCARHEDVKELFMAQVHSYLTQGFNDSYREELLREFKGHYVEIENLARGSRMFLRLREITINAHDQTISFEDDSSRYGTSYGGFRMRKANTSKWIYATLWSD